MITMDDKQYKQHLRTLQKMIQTEDWTAPDHLSAESQAMWRSVVPLRVRSPEKSFAQRMQELGFEKGKTRVGAFYKGLGLAECDGL